MQDGPLDRFVTGSFLIVAGFLIVILHKPIKEWSDWWKSRDSPVGHGEMWTGKYSRGGLIFTYAVIILFGVVLLALGISQIINAFR